MFRWNQGLARLNNNPSPSGPRPGKPAVRRPTPDEIPKKDNRS